jgi:hypothetical protein
MIEISKYCRVARWSFFKQKISTWVYFGGLGMKNVGIVHDHMEYFMAIW